MPPPSSCDSCAQRPTQFGWETEESLRARMPDVWVPLTEDASRPLAEWLRLHAWLCQGCRTVWFLDYDGRECYYREIAALPQRYEVLLAPRGDTPAALEAVLTPCSGPTWLAGSVRGLVRNWLEKADYDRPALATRLLEVAETRAQEHEPAELAHVLEILLEVIASARRERVSLDPRGLELLLTPIFDGDERGLSGLRSRIVSTGILEGVNPSAPPPPYRVEEELEERLRDVTGYVRRKEKTPPFQLPPRLLSDREPSEPPTGDYVRHGDEDTPQWDHLEYVNYRHFRYEVLPCLGRRLQRSWGARLSVGLASWFLVEGVAAKAPAAAGLAVPAAFCVGLTFHAAAASKAAGRHGGQSVWGVIRERGSAWLSLAGLAFSFFAVLFVGGLAYTLLAGQGPSDEVLVVVAATLAVFLLARFWPVWVVPYQHGGRAVWSGPANSRVWQGPGLPTAWATTKRPGTFRTATLPLALCATALVAPWAWLEGRGWVFVAHAYLYLVALPTLANLTDILAAILWTASGESGERDWSPTHRNAA